MIRKTLIALTVCAPVLFNACAGSGTQQSNTTAPSAATTPSSAAARASTTPTPQTQVVSASAGEVKLASGGAGEANIKLDIAEGFHVHANPASDKFYIATEVQAAPQQGVTPGKPAYPNAVTRKLEFSDKPLALYEKEVVIKLPLRADKDAAKGAHTLRATIRVQACNEQACQPPRNLETTIPVLID